MNIHKAAINDQEKIAQCHRASIKILCQNDYNKNEIQNWLDVIQPYIYKNAIEKKLLLIAEENDEILGFGILDIANQELNALYIHPEHTNKGIAKNILAKFESIMLEKNAEILKLCSTLTAFGFYKHHGYIEADRPFHILSNGTKLTCIKMYKKLKDR
ncbi:MAG: GNAT family N-acetyltransferase [Candidatus Omnitrophica bacterium]|nr:GNAT family N-acetyltransferase [Candidatus Omnitrophota bacterium]MDD5080648.1 GNAT family N-acetyltransferase [Candidatus Omnitrophota bacterium]MDD5441059.1 GNAT family N-acetyltransferase [Candidatus Omnitrophota bacterium]